MTDAKPPRIPDIPEGRTPLRRLQPLRHARRVLVVVVSGFAMAAVMTAIVVSVFDPGRPAFRDRRPAVTTLPQLAAGASATPPEGLERGSLLGRAGFGEALGLMRSRATRVLEIRLTPSSANGILRRDDRSVTVDVDHTGRATTLEQLGRVGDAPTLPIARVDPSAPERAVRRAAARLGQPVGEVRAVTLRRVVAGVRWVLLFFDGQTVQADLRGRLVE